MKALLIASVLFVAGYAHADTSLTLNKPTAIPMSQVLKSKTPVAKCVNQKMGETGRYKNVKGSKPVFTATLPKNDEKAVDAIADGKSAWVCSNVIFDRDQSKIVKQ